VILEQLVAASISISVSVSISISNSVSVSVPIPYPVAVSIPARLLASFALPVELIVRVETRRKRQWGDEQRYTKTHLHRDITALTFNASRRPERVEFSAGAER
jgi:hypothetical protein